MASDNKGKESRASRSRAGRKKTGNGGNGGNGSRDGNPSLQVYRLARGSALWMGLMAEAAKAGFDCFCETLRDKDPLDVSFNNGIVQASVKGWAAAYLSAFNSTPITAKQPLAELLSSHPED